MIQRIAKHTLVHPRTGAPIVPLGLKKNGSPIWPILGAAEGDEGGDGDGTGDGAKGKDESGSEGQEDNDGKDNGKERASYSNEEYEALRERMKAADRRASTAEQKVKDHEKEGLSDLQKAQTEATEHKEAATVLANENRDLKMRVAFLTSNDVTWHDPEAALRLADLSEVLDDEGSIDKVALKKALTDLAKSKPFLVKQETASDDNDGEERPPSGGSVGSSKKKEAVKNTDALLRKYPALQR